MAKYKELNVAPDAIGTVVGKLPSILLQRFVDTNRLRTEARSTLIMCNRAEDSIWKDVEKTCMLKKDIFTYMVDYETGMVSISGFRKEKE